MDYSYYLIYDRRKRQLSFHVGSEKTVDTIVKLNGKNVEEIFERTIGILGKAGCLTPIKTGDIIIYSVRDDVGPVVGVFIITLRRARDLDYWFSFLEELFYGRFARLGGAFSTLLEAMISYAKALPVRGKRRAVQPEVLDAFSSAIKTLVRTTMARYG